MREFLEAVWPEIPTGQSLVIWTLPDKITRWASTLDEAETWARAAAETRDVYLGVAAGIEPDRGSEHRRLTNETALTIPGHVADIDYGDLGHKADKLFADEEAARAFVEALPIRPTVLVNSGGGLQAWWLYHEPWDLRDPAERQAAKELRRGWSDFIRAEAAEKHGRSVDGVADLSRVLRIPGTYNRKAGLVREVRLIYLDGPRADPSEYEPYRITSDYPIRAEWLDLRPSDALNGAAETLPWWPKLQVLCDVDPKFRATWANKDRPDLPSTSEFDLSLATKMWAAAWAEQEILDALIHWRRIHKLDPKPVTYYTRYTIPRSASSEWATRERESLKVHEVVQEASAAGVEPEIGNEEILAQIRAALGIPVTRLERHGELYTVVLANGKALKLGDREQLQRQDRWRAIAWEERVALRRLSNTAKNPAWDRVLDLMALVVVDKTTPEITGSGELAEWIAAHQSDITDLTGKPGDYKAGIYRADHRWAWLDAGRLYVVPARLRQALQAMGSTIRVTAQELQIRLQSLGGSTVVRSAKADGQVIAQRAWEFDPRTLGVVESKS